jgi:hypothetical protein
MRKPLFLATAVWVLAAASFAQVPTEPASANPPGQPAASNAPNSATPGDTPPSGTLLPVELSKALDAKKSKANDRIEARTATDLLAHGQIVVPRNTKIIGHVTEAKAHSKTSPDSTLGISFDRVLLKGGREVPLQVAVQAIARPLQVGSGPEANVPRPDRQAGLSAPGQHGPMGDASTSGVPSSYPGDLTPDPIARNGSTGSENSTIIPLSPTSKGVVGMKGLSLDTSGPAAILSSNSGNVRLEAGTQLILRVQ